MSDADAFDSPDPPGTPRHIPSDDTRATVRRMAEGQHTRAAIAEALGITTSALRRHYRDILDEFPPPSPVPPAGHVFKPGQSGNPGGQPKGTAAFRETCRTLADEGLAEARRRLLDPDTSGPAFVSLWTALRDTGYGKPKESIEHSGPDGGPIPTLAIATNDPVEAAKIYQRLMSGG